MSLACGDEEGSMPGSLTPVGKPISSWVGRRTACVLRRYLAKRKDHYSMSTVGRLGGLNQSNRIMHSVGALYVVF